MVNCVTIISHVHQAVYYMRVMGEIIDGESSWALCLIRLLQASHPDDIRQ